MMYYSNEDYTVKSETINGDTRYFITYRMADSKTRWEEIPFDIYKLYCNEFRRPYRKQKKNEAKHRAYLNVEDYLEAHTLDGGFLQSVKDVEQISLDRVRLNEVEKLLQTCTATQKRRFRLCVYEEISLCDAARMEKCDEKAIRQSIDAVQRKIKKYLTTTSDSD